MTEHRLIQALGNLGPGESIGTDRGLILREDIQRSHDGPPSPIAFTGESVVPEAQGVTHQLWTPTLVPNPQLWNELLVMANEIVPRELRDAIENDVPNFIDPPTEYVTPERGHGAGPRPRGMDAIDCERTGDQATRHHLHRVLFVAGVLQHLRHDEEWRLDHRHTIARQDEGRWMWHTPHGGEAIGRRNVQVWRGTIDRIAQTLGQRNQRGWAERLHRSQGEAPGASLKP